MFKNLAIAPAATRHQKKPGAVQEIVPALATIRWLLQTKMVSKAHSIGAYRRLP